MKHLNKNYIVDMFVKHHVQEAVKLKKTIKA